MFRYLSDPDECKKNGGGGGFNQTGIVQSIKLLYFKFGYNITSV